MLTHENELPRAAASVLQQQTNANTPLCKSNPPPPGFVPAVGGAGARPDASVLAAGEHASSTPTASAREGAAGDGANWGLEECASDRARAKVPSLAGDSAHWTPGDSRPNRNGARNSAGGPAASVPAPFTSPADVYLATVGPRSRETLAGDLRRITRELSILIGGRATDYCTFPWHTLTPGHTTALRRVLADALAPATTNRMLACLRGVLRACWRLGQIDADTLARLGDLPRVRGKSPLRGRALAVGEVRALLATCQRDATPIGIRDSAILHLLIHCGLRRAELVGLDVGDCNIDRAEVIVRRAKGGIARTLRIPSEALEPLAAWMELRGARATAAALFVPVYDSALARDRRLDSQSVYEMLRRRCIQAGVKRCSPHDLRRTFITRLLERGTDLGRVQRAAGHADLGTTLRYDRRA